MKYILSIDQGTSSTRCIVFDEEGNQKGISQIEHKQIYPNEGWVEHDPIEIKENVLKTMSDAKKDANIDWNSIKSIGITNQRETVVAWNKKTGNVLHNAIVWQCRRTAGKINELKKENYENIFHEKTGLVLDAYFSGTKMGWLLDHSQKVIDQKNDLAFGTIDSWIIYFLTGQHVTDASNASRTLLYNLKTNQWDSELSEILKVPIDTLPTVNSNCESPFGIYKIEGVEIPIFGVLGDQQAALFGQAGFKTGSVKSTYGTGNFILQNTGSAISYSASGLLTTIGWQIGNDVNYAMEGSVFVTGAALQWLRDNVGVFSNYIEFDELADTVENAGEVIFVPALAGLGAPYWDSSARGSIFGITRATTKGHLIHATLDSIAYQTNEVIELMESESQTRIPDIRVDGGITQSKLMLQKQANVSQKPVVKPRNTETTALGAAMIAGYKLIWDSFDELSQINPPTETIQPEKPTEYSSHQHQQWKKAIQRSRDWI